MTRYITFGDSHPFTGQQVRIIGETADQILKAALFLFGRHWDVLRDQPASVPVLRTINVAECAVI